MIRHILGTCSVCVCAAALPVPCQAQVLTPDLTRPETLDQGFVIVVDDEADLAGPNSPIYVASNHVGWVAGLEEMKMSPRSDGRWQIVLPKPTAPGSMQFKFTRGSWDLVEVDDSFDNIDNRTLPGVDLDDLRPGERPVFEFTVPAWADQRPSDPVARALDPYRAIEVTGDIRRVQMTVGYGPTAGSVRDVLVWLPPRYDDPASADRTYPVLYLQDGQNLFEKLPHVPGEWRADETATALIESGEIEPIIIVGIPHAGEHRSSEYLPVEALRGVPPRADDYLGFLTREVMPRTERMFRIDQSRRAIGGASLGAVVSVYAAIERPDLFSAVIAESMPTLRAAQDQWLDYLGGGKWPARLFIGMGGQEAGVGEDDLNNVYVEWANRLSRMADEKGLSEDDRKLLIDPEAVHDEHAWATRLPEALRFLYGK